MRKLIFFLLTLLQLALSSQDYYSLRDDRTMCAYQQGSKGSECGVDGGVTPLEAKDIVNIHNRYRAKVARGKEPKGDPGPQPQAANMQALVWDQELAKVAQSWADQCVNENDNCRNDPRSNVGQNIYSIFSYNTVNWSVAIDNWYNTVSNLNSSTISLFEENSRTDHYTQMVWAETTRIGCGRITYVEAARQRMRKIVLSGSSIDKTTRDESSSHKSVKRQINIRFSSGSVASNPSYSTRPNNGLASLGAYETMKRMKENILNGGINGGSNFGINVENRPNNPATGNPSNGNVPIHPGYGYRPTYSTVQSVSYGYHHETTAPHQTNLNTHIVPVNGWSIYIPAAYLPFFTTCKLVNCGQFTPLPVKPTGSSKPSVVHLPPSSTDTIDVTTSGISTDDNTVSPEINTDDITVSSEINTDNITVSPEINMTDSTVPPYVSPPSTERIDIEPPTTTDTTYVNSSLTDKVDLQQPTTIDTLDAEQPSSIDTVAVTPPPEEITVKPSINPDIYNIGRDYIFVCNYGSAGNRPNAPMYIVGAPCSACPDGTTCKNSLCVTKDTYDNILE